MKDIGIVKGSGIFAVPVYFGKDTVYVHSDITQVALDNDGNEVEDMFKYREIQYTYPEYYNTLTMNSIDSTEIKVQSEIMSIVLGDIE